MKDVTLPELRDRQTHCSTVRKAIEKARSSASLFRGQEEISHEKGEGSETGFKSREEVIRGSGLERFQVWTTVRNGMCFATGNQCNWFRR